MESSERIVRGLKFLKEQSIKKRDSGRHMYKFN